MSDDKKTSVRSDEERVAPAIERERAGTAFVIGSPYRLLDRSSKIPTMPAYSPPGDWTHCDACDGTGRYGFRDDDACEKCAGLGMVLEEG